MAVRANKYGHVAQQLKTRIEAGHYADGLPGKRALAEEFAVTSVTMAKAIGLLRAQGVVRTEYAKGTFVTRLKRRRTHTIGVVVHDVPGGPLHQQLLTALHDRAGEFGEHLILEGHGGNPVKEMDLVRKLIERAEVDGIILWPAREKSVEALDYLKERDIPFVLVPEPDPVVYAGNSTVSADDTDAAAKVMAHLIERGRRKIAFVVPNERMNDPAIRERYEQYHASIKSIGMDLAKVIRLQKVDSGSYFKGPPDFASLLRRYDAAFCATDMCAVAVVACCVRHGIRIPADLAVTGYDNSEVAKALDLTSVEQHFERIGHHAIDLVLEEINSGCREPRHLSLKSELIVRGSTV